MLCLLAFFFIAKLMNYLLFYFRENFFLYKNSTLVLLERLQGKLFVIQNVYTSFIPILSGGDKQKLQLIYKYSIMCASHIRFFIYILIELILIVVITIKLIIFKFLIFNKHYYNFLIYFDFIVIKILVQLSFIFSHLLNGILHN